MIPAWEEANGRPFMVQGERVVDKIHDALAEKEAAKEVKKVSRTDKPVSVPKSDTASSHEWVWVLDHNHSNQLGQSDRHRSEQHRVQSRNAPLLHPRQALGIPLRQ